MVKTKRIFSLLMAVIMLYGVLPVSVFAEYEPTAYEKGKAYSVNGVEYFVEENGSVTVKGEAADGVPERVEILSELGGFAVTAIGAGAFYKCEALKEIIIPESVTRIEYPAFRGSGLTDIEIKGKNVNVSTDFHYTPLWDSDDNWINKEDYRTDDVFIVSGYAVTAFVRGELVLGEDIVGIGEQCFKYGNNGMTKLTVLNPDCHIFDVENVFPSHVTLCGYKGSTIQAYAERYGYNFSAICNCNDTVFVPASFSYCDGTVGYGEGYWCEHCRAYASGGAVDTTFEHVDTDTDGVCDLCKQGTDTEILKAGQCGDKAVWTLSDDGTLRIAGTGSVYSDYYYSTEKEPWDAYKDIIKVFVAEDGIRGLSAISFEDYKSLETVTLADSVLSLPKSFKNCTALKQVNIPRSIRAIGYDCFWKCTSLESIFIPKNVTEIGSDAFYKCTNLNEIDFETGYVSIGRDAFYGTAAYNNPDNVRDGFLYIDNCLIAEITSGATSLVLGPEITSIATGWDDYPYSKVTEVTVYNPDCAFPRDDGAVPPEAKLKGYVGSTAWFYSKDFGLNSRFEALVPHTHTEVIDIPAVAPTADKPGYTHLSHCSVCGETVSERQRISPDEYNISVDNGVTTARKTNEATIEADGTDIIITFDVKNEICLSSIEQTVIYKVGEVKLSETEFTYNGKVQKPGVSVKDSRGNALVKGRDYEVEYSANSKYCGEYTVRVDYIGNYAGGKTLYYEIVVEAVSPTVSSATKESITLSWEKGHSDLVYRIYSVDADGNLNKIDDTRNGSYEVTSLDAGTEYSFLVRAYVKDGNGKVYWGDKGEAVDCATRSDKTGNSIIDFLMNYCFKMVMLILRIFFAI